MNLPLEVLAYEPGVAADGRPVVKLTWRESPLAMVNNETYWSHELCLHVAYRMLGAALEAQRQAIAARIGTAAKVGLD